MKESIIAEAKTWSENPYFDEADRLEIVELIKANNEEELTERFEKDLEFGTGGMRSIIGMGKNRMNKYNIRKATQALAQTVLQSSSSEASAVVSYDCRHFSHDFAKEVARVFAGNGIKTFIFNELTPTPILSYAIRHLQASTGVMITASHNPKEYNGYKAYWSDGAQLTPPYDNRVIEEFTNIASFEQIKLANFDSSVESGQIKWIGEEITDSFYKSIEEQSLNYTMCRENGGQLKAVYTSLHGTGLKACQEISQRMGFSHFAIVKEQAEYDPNFSNVETTPNPEDPAALKQAVAQMLETNADIAYGTDPDCDRLGVVINNNGKAVFLNGNQIAILMIEYLFSQRKEQNKIPANPLVLKSIVTSPLQDVIVENFGGRVINTLTGFKWMSQKIKELEDNKTPHDFIYASEESFGYMPNRDVRDKDAVASISLMNELCLHHKLQGRNLIQALDAIYENYGFAKESLIANTYPGLSGRSKINNIMEHFRKNARSNIGPQEVIRFKDYQELKEYDYSTNQEESLDMVSSNVLGFEFKSGHSLYLRPSGTEPKIKFYTMVNIKEGSLTQKKEEAERVIKEIEHFIHKTIERL